MAIFSMHHASVGRSTHAAGTAGAHVDYLSRSGACRETDGERMPVPEPGHRGGECRKWLDGQELGDRKNARVIDKVMVALPRELNAEQRVQLVRDFAEEATQGRASWVAGIHDLGKDVSNPHAHIVFRDRDVSTGKRVMNLSEKGSTEKLREAWEKAANSALERAGYDVRIDRRSLLAQGIVDRQPTQHLGANVTQMEKRWERENNDFHGFSDSRPASQKRQRIEQTMERRQRAMDKARAEYRAKLARENASAVQPSQVPEKAVPQPEQNLRPQIVPQRQSPQESLEARIDREGREAGVRINAVRKDLGEINAVLGLSVDEHVNRMPSVAKPLEVLRGHQEVVAAANKTIDRCNFSMNEYRMVHPVRTFAWRLGLPNKKLETLDRAIDAAVKTGRKSQAQIGPAKDAWEKAHSQAKPGVERQRMQLQERRVILVQENDRLAAALKRQQEQYRAKARERQISRGRGGPDLSF